MHILDNTNSREQINSSEYNYFILHERKQQPKAMERSKRIMTLRFTKKLITLFYGRSLFFI